MDCYRKPESKTFKQNYYFIPITGDKSSNIFVRKKKLSSLEVRTKGSLLIFFTFMLIKYLFLTVQPILCYRTFGGRPNESQWITEAQNLADLTMKEPGVVRDHYYLNWYDPPLQLFNRLNEVWIVKNMSKKNPPKEIKNHNDLNEVC